MLSQGIQWNTMECQRQGITRQQEIMKNILRDSNEECKRLILNSECPTGIKQVLETNHFLSNVKTR